MAPRSGNGSGGARVALVGATTNDGARLREALADFGVHGSRVDLYCTVGEDVADVSEDGLGGFWLWAVAGKTRLLAAQQAVRLADRLAGLRE